MKTLVITASPKGDNSQSIGLANFFADKLNNQNIEYVDVSTLDFPPYDQHMMDTINSNEFDNPFCNGIINQFTNSDRYIFAFPNWNLLCPPSLVNYILYAIKVGISFNYSEKGPIGLLENKKALIIMSSGGFYNTDSDCYGVGWLKSVMNLCGVNDVEIVTCGGSEAIPDMVDKLIAEAQSKLDDLAKKWNA